MKINNKLKLFISLISIISLILLSTYSFVQHVNYYPKIKDLLENPEKYHNKITKQTGQISPDTNILSSGGDKIRIKSNIPLRKDIFGSTSIIGRFDKEGYIEIKEIHYSDYNNVKYFTSILGLFLFVYIFLKEWKITKRGFENA